MSLLDTRRLQVFQDHGREVLLAVVAGLGFGEMVNEFIILNRRSLSQQRNACSFLLILGWDDPTGWIANVLPPRGGLLLP